MVTQAKELIRYSPLDGSEVGRVSVTAPKEIPAVVARARQAFPAWSNTTIESRGLIIRKASALLEAARDELAAVVRAETGKPLGASQGEITGAIEMGYLMASHGRHPHGVVLPSAVPGRHVRVQRMPRGVAALIVTYNAPLPNYAWKVFPALMAGNVAVLKPSPATPVSAEMFVKILHQAGVPENVLQLVHGGGDTAAALIDQGVELVSFTGSYATGQKVVEASAKHLAKTVIELGGANPLIVCDDADIEKAVAVVLDSAFSNAGQRCSSASRIFIQESIYQTFRDALLEAGDKVTFGVEVDVDVSTLIDSDSVVAFENYLSSATQAGGTVHRVGLAVGAPPESACLAQPAIIEGLDVGSHEGGAEFFGPATRLFSFANDDDAVLMANTSEYGLTAAVWSSDIARAEHIVSRLAAGVININGPTHGAEVNMPFGGVKNSGNGSRDAGFSAIEQYSDVQVVSTFFGV
jgi:alpha-ketoglutaric semialdehyde dehydrogenase